MPIVFIILAVIAYLYFKNSGTSDAQTDAMVERIKTDYFQDASDAVREFGGVISWKRILAIIAVESGGAPESTGSIGERGLMQITRDALTDFNSIYGTRAKWDELYEERLNIFVGTGYLRILQTRLNDVDKATRAYNVGIRNVNASATAGTDYLEKVKFMERLF